jgi:hypothetical protein
MQARLVIALNNAYTPSMEAKQRIVEHIVFHAAQREIPIVEAVVL